MRIGGQKDIIRRKISVLSDQDQVLQELLLMGLCLLADEFLRSSNKARSSPQWPQLKVPRPVTLILETVASHTSFPLWEFVRRCQFPLDLI